MMSSLDAGYDWSARRAAGVDSQDYQDHSLRLEYNGLPGADWQVGWPRTRAGEATPT